jgi:hypothetical protein
MQHLKKSVQRSSGARDMAGSGLPTVAPRKVPLDEPSDGDAIDRLLADPAAEVLDREDILV